jgi:hypothetical protein
MHKCTDGYIFVDDKEMSWDEPYYGWRRININYCPICGFAMQPERSKREDVNIKVQTIQNNGFPDLRIRRNDNIYDAVL